MERAKGKNQLREVNSMVDFLFQTTTVDDKKIETLNNLLLDFEHRLRDKKENQNGLRNFKTIIPKMFLHFTHLTKQNL